MEKPASQISSTRRTEIASRRGFTLVEVLIGASLSTVLLAGVLSTVLLLGRTSANIVNYSDIEARARKSLEQFSREVRLAYDVPTFSGTSVTLSIPDTTSAPKGTGTGAYTVTYTFDSVNRVLTRNGPPIDNPTGTVETTTLIADVQPIPGSASFLKYYRYVKPTSYPLGQGYVDGFAVNTATTNREIKQIEVSFLLRRESVTVAAATNKVLSARFILRNK
ncbi:PilW family protein [Horticoccus sp. 23ND18S-11]|uniref:PilW family protein n=1 Tax=Horticoccus sp. 23ND18S-11 TaxID=3391832 RepID=UPI0039C8F784